MSDHNVTLTDDERDEAVNALYERQFEAKRHVRDFQSRVKQHTDHGEQCCSGPARIEHEEASRAAMQQRLDAVNGALWKLGEDV